MSISARTIIILFAERQSPLARYRERGHERRLRNRITKVNQHGASIELSATPWYGRAGPVTEPKDEEYVRSPGDDFQGRIMRSKPIRKMVGAEPKAGESGQCLSKSPGSFSAIPSKARRRRSRCLRRRVRRFVFSNFLRFRISLHVSDLRVSQYPFFNPIKILRGCSVRKSVT